jgi:hypothetical protein
MRALSNAEFLTLWEEGRGLHSLDRGLLAIRAMGAEPEAAGAADWPLGRRNQALARLHQSCFGARIAGWTECGQCGEKLEFGLDCRSLIEQQSEASDVPVVMNGYSFRPPTSRDLARLASDTDAESAARRLIDSCRITIRENSDAIGAEPACAAKWSAGEIEELEAKMAAADPLAEILLSFECPVCQSRREQPLDLPEFLWAELEALAKRLLSEIHILAMAYGWSEDRILALSDARRAVYLQMVQA